MIREISTAVLVLLIIACAPGDADETKAVRKGNSHTTATEMTALEAEQIIVVTSADAISAIKNRDFKKLASFVHPVEGIRFSPYAYVDTSTDIVFSAAEIRSVQTNKAGYTWGSHDGSGDPILLTFNDYYDRFIYDADFANAEKTGYNRQISSGNSINNAPNIYTGSIIVEYYFSGFKPEYEGMDWRSLRLVFARYAGRWCLVGIIHDEWTV